MINIKKLEEKSSDVLENMKFISQHATVTAEKGTQPKLFKQAKNLNYADNYQTDELQIETNEQMAALNLLTDYIKINHSHRPPEVNYFLDDTPTNLHPKSKQELALLNKPQLLGTCLRNTWSKGLAFFYLDQGSVVRVLSVKQGYANIEFEQQKGIIHINDLQLH